MPEIDIKITINGVSKSGKTTVAHIIKEALQNEGLFVELRDEDDPYPHPEAKEAMRGKRIEVETLRVNRTVR